MAFKSILLPEIGEVRLYKRKGSRHLRLSITSNGIVRVTIPTWLPYKVGTEFAATKADWIRQSRPSVHLFRDGETIGKRHTLQIHHEPVDRIRTRVTPDTVKITVPLNTTLTTPHIQDLIRRAAEKALKQEAEANLPVRIRALSAAHEFHFRSVTIKKLRGRWGSCNHKQEIVLNSYLMQLPWELIDYVLLHELVHTRIMAHGPKFWNELSTYVPDLPQVRRTMRGYRPMLNTQQ